MNKILRLKEVTKLTTLSRSSIYRLMSDEEFPTSIKLGDRAVAWLEAEVEQWIEERIASSKGTYPKKVFKPKKENNLEAEIDPEAEINPKAEVDHE